MLDLKASFEQAFPEGSRGGECAAFAEKIANFGPVGDSLASKLAYMKSHGSTNLDDILVGDVLFTDDSKVNGHVCIVNGDAGDSWRVTESNFFFDKLVHHTRLVPKKSSHLKGHVRATLLVKILNPMIQKEILILTNTPADYLAYFKAGVQAYCDKVKARTNGQFVINVQFAVTDQPIHTIHATNTDGHDTVFADPKDIILAAARYTKKYDSYCLFYDDTKVIGDHPTNPTENAAADPTGVTAYSIPMNWIGVVPPITINAIDGSVYSAEFYFGHENSHSDFAIINSKGAVGLRDKTHDPMPAKYGSTRPIDNPNQTDFYVDLLIELKPYWQYLGQTAGSMPKGDDMLIVLFKVKGKPALYEFVQQGWRGYADQEPESSDVAGKTIKTIELDQAEFDKLTQFAPIKK